MQGLEAEAERLQLEEGGRKKEAEEYQTHLEEELAESQVLSPPSTMHAQHFTLDSTMLTLSSSH